MCASMVKLDTLDKIFEETCSHMKRSYVRPSGQEDAVVLISNEKNKITNWVARLFLPEGYPDSVSQDYLPYQVWDTLQAFCSTVAGILATQEVLRGLGVGDTNATPLAATITWVLKDGCGHIGRILFAFTHGIYMDAYSKKWRMYADILNDAAMCVEMALPSFGMCSFLPLCISSVMKAIVGIAGGATRVAMTQHHAVRGNLADVSAKDAAQETAVNLGASIASLLIISCFGSSLLIFLTMLFLHVTFNYFAVRAVCLRTLNDTRFLLVIDKYLRREKVLTPSVINRSEPLDLHRIGPCMLDLEMCGFKIIIGASIHDVVCDLNAGNLIELRDLYSAMRYILAVNLERKTLHVYLKKSATVDDILCSYFHAVQLAYATCAINPELPSMCKVQKSLPPFTLTCITVQSKSRSKQESHAIDSLLVHNPSTSLHGYLNEIVAKEWPNLREGLQQAGWDLSKHLLVTGQWRIHDEN